MRFNSPLFTAEAAVSDGGAAPATASAAAPAPAANAPAAPSKVVIDGVEYTPEQLKQELGKSKQYKDAVGNLFKGDAGLAEKQQAARWLLASENKYTNEQIETWVKQNMGTPEPEAAPGNDPRVEEAHRLAVEGRKHQLNSVFNTSLSNALDKHQDISTLVAAATRLQGEAKATSIKEGLSKALRQEALVQFKNLTTISGRPLNEEMVEKGVEEAAKIVAERHKAVIGDPSTLGRSAETSRGQNPYSQKKLAPTFEYKKGMSLGQAENEALAWITNDLSVLAEETPSKGVASRL